MKRTLYVHRQLLNAADFIAWAKGQGFRVTLPADEMHVTVARSKKIIDWPEPVAGEHISAGGVRVVKPLGPDGAVVLRFDDPALLERWGQLVIAGASWDWPTYQPHVSITYQPGDIDLAEVDPYNGPLVFGPEVFEEILPNWMDSITEKTMTPEQTHKLATAITEAALERLAKSDELLDEVLAKLQPGAGAVHVSSASGGSRKKKPLAFDASNGSDDVEKSDEDVELEFTIEKMVPESQMIFGWASTSMIDGRLVVDKQGDSIEVHVLEKAAYDFVLVARSHGDMHSQMDTGRMIESLVFTPEKAALGITAKNEKGHQIFGWWTGFKVDDPDLWERHKRGERPEFSIGGRARSVEL